MKIRPMGTQLFHADRQTETRRHYEASSRAILRKRLKTKNNCQ